MPRAFKKVQTTDKDVNKLQENIGLVLEPVLQSSIIDGVLLRNLALSSSSTTLIEHKLGRKPLGWVLVRKRAQSDVWDTQDSNELQSSTLALNCSSDVTVDLWVF